MLQLVLRRLVAQQIRSVSTQCCNMRPNPPFSERLVGCTTYRWLHNEETQLSLRRLDFSVEAICDIAARAAGATRCVELGVLAEGAFNRAFFLILNNRAEVIVRMPFRNAGPRSLLTHSEVATMDFVRSRLGAPVPKVLAWNASSDNPVGCEYIVMEKCPGQMLADRLDTGVGEDTFITDLAGWQTRLAAIPFSQIGSIYYKEDVEEELQSRRLYADGEPDDACSERFRIGPSVDRRFYRSERTHMRIDRGPWKDTHSYIRAAVNCEIAWIQSCSESPSAKTQLGAHHSPSRHIHFLRQWLSLAPAVVPASAYCTPVLSHPDLHAANVFVTDTSPMSISSIIDWQNATTGPLFEAVMPSFLIVDTDDMRHIKLTGDFEQPTLPPNLQELDISVQEEVAKEVEQVALMRRYLEVVRQLHPLLYNAMRAPEMELISRAIYYSSHSWSDGLPNLERSLMVIWAAYGSEIPAHKNYSTCPISFSSEDQIRHKEEFKKVIWREEWLEYHVHRMMRNAGIVLHKNGSVPTEQYEEAKQEAARIFTVFTRSLTTERTEMTRRLWPLREGKFLLSAESCI